MALIQRKINNGQSARRGDDRNDLHLVIHANQTGKVFDFQVKRNRVVVTCKNTDDHQKVPKNFASANDWRASLSETEKLRVFALILDEYRKHSIGDEHGYRGAALGVVGDKIYLGANTATDQLASPYDKVCAEQNMVNAASDLVAYQQVKREGWDKFNPPQAPKFDAIYMMGGVSQTNIPVSCPCGKCTDVLAKNMAIDGKVYALPILSDEMFRKINTTADPNYISVNSQAASLSQVSRTSDCYTVWQTTIDHLNNQRVIQLDDAKSAMQREGFEVMYKRAFGVDGLLEERATRIWDKLLRNEAALKKPQITDVNGLWNAVVVHVQGAWKHVKNLALQSFVEDQSLHVEQAAKNEFLERRSIAQLDIAVTANGSVPLTDINTYLREQITHALADRVRGRRTKDDHLTKRQWVAKNISSIRCVVVQLDDGTFHSSIQVAGSFDPSMPNPEVAVLGDSAASFGRYGVRRVWCMEMSPEAVNAGQLRTSPKEGIERIIKRGSKAGVDFTYIPLNDGSLTEAALSNLTRTFDAETIFPAAFKGSRPVEAMEIQPPKAWQALEMVRREGQEQSVGRVIT